MTTSTATAKARPILYFDVVRGGSAQLVVLGHALNIFIPSVTMARGAGDTWVAKDGAFYVQNLGVVLFFVLSGFLVTRSLLSKRASYGPVDYGIDRAARIFTPFIPAVLLIWFADWLVFGSGRTTPFLDINIGPATGLANLTMLFDNPVFEGVGKVTGLDVVLPRIGTGAPFWTVAIEWWLYLAFGFIWFLVHRRIGWNPVLLAIGAFALLTSIGNLLGNHGVSGVWIIGMGYALLSVRDRRPSRRVHTLATGAAVAAIAAMVAMGAHDPYHPIIMGATAVVVLSGYHAGVSSDRVTGEATPVQRAAASLSDHSYSLYLVHFTVLIYLSEFLPEDLPAAASIAIGFVVANVVAYGFWWLFERHYPAIGRRLRTRYGNLSPAPAPAAGRTPA